MKSKIIAPLLICALAIPALAKEPSTRRGVKASSQVSETASDSKKRGVRRGAVQPATIAGTVLDSVTGAPISTARVEAAGRTAFTDDAGKFELDATEGRYTIKVTRWGYAELTKMVDLVGGKNQIELRAVKGPIVQIEKLSGETIRADYGTLEFGYVVTFVGYQKAPHIDFCVNGTERKIERSQIAKINGPAVQGPTNGCCRFDQAQQIGITLKSGEQLTGILLDSCEGSTMDVITFNYDSGQEIYIPLTQVKSITMP